MRQIRAIRAGDDDWITFPSATASLVVGSVGVPSIDHLDQKPSAHSSGQILRFTVGIGCRWERSERLAVVAEAVRVGRNLAVAVRGESLKWPVRPSRI